MSPKPAPVELYGRAVGDPMESRTKHGARVAHFPLEVIRDDELVVEPVVVFGPYATDVLDYVHEGGDYTVRGEVNRFEKNGLIFRNVKLKTFALGDKRGGEK